MISEFQYDYLIIGTGIAGLSYALEVSRSGKVAIVTKKNNTASNTNFAQGGIAAVVDQKRDRLEWHLDDTLKAGGGLCHRDSVELLVFEGAGRIEQLREWGVNFTSTFQEGKLVLALNREGGHRTSRIVHHYDSTGQEVESALVNRVKRNPNIDLFEHHALVDLITDHHLHHSCTPSKRCFGAYVLNTATNEVTRFLSRITVLATGGCGQVWKNTTNPDIATGDGIAASARAGAKLANLEFMQFHPTTLHYHNFPPFLLTEALRGFGGRLKNLAGERFMPKYHPDAELATRDIVARAIDAEMKRRGDTYVELDVTHLPAPETRERFPTIYETLLGYGIDITQQRIPVVPAAHYMCGGVVTDLLGRTSIERLYAVGEVAMTGVHGANRLASNSLLEALVFSHTAATDSIHTFKQYAIQSNIPEWDAHGTIDPEEWVLISHDREEIREIMADYVGIVRSGLRLDRAKRRLTLLHNEIEEFWRRTTVTLPLLELRNIALVAMLVIESANRRKESRGLHFRTDYPTSSPEFQTDTILDHGSIGMFDTTY